MSRYRPARAAAAAAAVAAIVLAAGPPAHADDPMPGRIVGTFTSYGTGAPVAGAFVEVVDAAGGITGSGVTDAAGSFTVADLPPGDYRVGFDSNVGFQWFHQKSDFEAADPVTVTSGADTAIAEQTIPTGSLEVTVADSVTGQPIPGACVEVSGTTFRNGCSSTGIVSFADLTVGTYQLSATADELHFFGDATAAVTAGQLTRATVRLDPAAAISVRARDAATGAALADVCVRAAPTTSPGLVPEPGGACTGADGRVIVGRLHPGDYRVLADPSSPLYGVQWVSEDGGTGLQQQAATVRARAGRVTPAPPAKLDRAGTVTGTVTDVATGAPVADICTLPYAFASNQGPDRGPQCTGADGRFTLDGLGPYAWPVEFVDFSGAYAWQWSGGAAQRLAATPVRVRAGRAVTANAALAAGGRITGRITGRDWATAFVYNTVSGDYAGPYGPTDETGSYTVGGLATQQVKVEARAAGPDATRWFVDAASFDTATPVAVAAGGTVAGIDVRLPS